MPGFNPTIVLPGTFQPNWFSTCILWLRSDLGITIATGVSQWNDITTNAHNATQATGSLQPTYTSSNGGFGGRPTLNATGTQFLTVSSLTLNQPFTVIMIGNNNGGGTAGLFGGAGNEPAAFANGGINAAMYAGTQVNSSTSITSKCVMAYVYNSGTGLIYVNSSGAAVQTGSIGSLNLSGTFQIMNDNLIGVAMSGSVSEFMVFNTNLSSAQLKEIFKYVSMNYAGSWS
jgi:hypothetical protein